MLSIEKKLLNFKVTSQALPSEEVEYRRLSVTATIVDVLEARASGVLNSRHMTPFFPCSSLPLTDYHGQSSFKFLQVFFLKFVVKFIIYHILIHISIVIFELWL